MTRRRGLALTLALVAGCGRVASVAELRADLAALPVPRGASFVGESESTHDGPKFSSTRYETVARTYASSIPCLQLQRAWADTLRAERRGFRIANYPHKFGAIGSLEIEITDRGHPLGINIGTDDGRCESPSAYSMTRPH